MRACLLKELDILVYTLERREASIFCLSLPRTSRVRDKAKCSRSYHGAFSIRTRHIPKEQSSRRKIDKAFLPRSVIRLLRPPTSTLVSQTTQSFSRTSCREIWTLDSWKRRWKKWFDGLFAVQLGGERQSTVTMTNSWSGVFESVAQPLSTSIRLSAITKRTSSEPDLRRNVRHDKRQVKHTYLGLVD